MASRSPRVLADRSNKHRPASASKNRQHGLLSRKLWTSKPRKLSKRHSLKFQYATNADLIYLLEALARHCPTVSTVANAKLQARAQLSGESTAFGCPSLREFCRRQVVVLLASSSTEDEPVHRLLDRFWPLHMPSSLPPTGHYLLEQCFVCMATRRRALLSGVSREGEYPTFVTLHRQDLPLCRRCHDRTWTRSELTQVLDVSPTEASDVFGANTSPHPPDIRRVAKALRQEYGSVFCFVKNKRQTAYRAI